MEIMEELEKLENIIKAESSRREQSNLVLTDYI